jgi:hypothetical protein
MDVTKVSGPGIVRPRMNRPALGFIEYYREEPPKGCLVFLKNEPLGVITFTRLYAKISQERGAFTVSVRLQNHLKKSETAWGEELAPSIEVASSMIGALAARFLIPEKCISIEFGMENYRDGTRH